MSRILKSLKQEQGLLNNKLDEITTPTLIIHGVNDSIVSMQTIEELETLAQTNFASIASSDKPLPEIVEPLYLPQNQQQFIKVKPVKNDKQLIISFAMPAIDKYYRHKPEAVIAYLFGHEGKGSILSLLKNKKWALGLTAGSGINGSNFKDFNINMQLTEFGLSCLEEILNALFYFIKKIKLGADESWRLQEKVLLGQQSFDFSWVSE